MKKTKREIHEMDSNIELVLLILYTVVLSIGAGAWNYFLMRVSTPSEPHYLRVFLGIILGGAVYVFLLIKGTNLIFKFSDTMSKIRENKRRKKCNIQTTKKR